MGDFALSMDCPMMELSNDIHFGLLTVQRANSAAGWEMLREAGKKAHDALQYQHPATVPELILLLSHLQIYRQKSIALKPTVMAILSLLEHLCDHLDPEHPVRLLAAAFISDSVLRNLCGALFEVIGQSFTCKLSESRKVYVESRLTLTFAWIYLTQERDRDVEALLNSYSGDQAPLTSDPYQQAEACRILAKSRSRLGRLQEADELLARAWAALEEAGLSSTETAHHLLLDRVQAKSTMGDLGSAERLLHQVLTIVETQSQARDTDISYVLYLLRNVYLKQGKTRLAVELARRYPAFFK
jgi:hypothetical protein